ncbi:hypothetical protein MMC06_002226 [Schaereria dolodes]|nr:hypothetical protein [Schaereria dolodes]
MPTYRSITISLVSQFDILSIPEYAPPSVSNDPFIAQSTPKLVSPDLSLVSVYIPTYPSSQFWLSYSISPPHPPNALYYFKLFLNGTHVISWGCGEQDEYKGKTMFGLYGTGETWLGAKGIERRVLCFASDTNGGDDGEKTSGNIQGDIMEVKVYRSKGRKRIQPEVQSFDYSPRTQNIVSKRRNESGEEGIWNLLIDPQDELERLGIASPTPSSRASSLAANSEGDLSKDSTDRGPYSIFSLDGTSNKQERVENTSTNPMYAIAPSPVAVFVPPSTHKALRPSPSKPLLQAYPRVPTPIPDTLDFYFGSDNSRARLMNLTQRISSSSQLHGLINSYEGDKDGGIATEETKIKRTPSLGIIRNVIDSAVRRKGRNDD